MIVYKAPGPLGELVGDVRGYGMLNAASSPVTAGAVTAAESSMHGGGIRSIWRPVLIGTLTATAAWLVTRLLETAFEDDSDESEEVELDEEDDVEDDEDSEEDEA